MNKITKKFLKYLKSVKLSEKEKDVLRYRISEFIAFNPIRSNSHIPKKSFYFSIFTLRAISKGVALVLIVLIVVGGTSVSYASTDSLPGDALYSVKININENIEEKLALTKEAKVEVQSAKIERRLTEAKTLSDKKELSPENKKIVNENLKKNVEKVTQTIEVLKNEGNIELALAATSKITPVLEAHREVLVENKDKKDKQDQEAKPKTLQIENASLVLMAEMETEDSEEDSLIDAVDAAIKKVEEAEIRVIEKATENKESADKVTQENTISVEQKIEDIKKANAIEAKNIAEEEEEKAKESQKIEDMGAKNETEIKEEVMSFSANINADTAVADSKNITPASQKMLVNPEIIEKATVKVFTETEVELKIRVAEELLKKADEEKSNGNYKEALKLSQFAKKIIQQIEEYKKIKDLEVKTENSLEVKTDKSTTKPIVDSGIKPLENSTTNEVKPITEIKSGTDVNTDLTTTLPKEMSSIELEAAAIKSIKETGDSFKKLNFNQEAQTRLLP